MKLKFYIVGYDFAVQKMFWDKGYYQVSDPAEAHIVVFTGGADVHPRFYNMEAHPTTGTNIERDIAERDIYHELRDDQLKVGICRGSQFLCVMNGGILYQDVDKHAIRGTHTMFYKNALGEIEEHQTTSTHHQMQYPFASSKLYEIWGTAKLCTYRDLAKVEREPLAEDRDADDVEIVFWPESWSLGFQGHPEYSSMECRELFFTVLDRAIRRGPFGYKAT